MFSANTVDKASAELTKLRANRARLDGKGIALESELNQLRSVTADELLDSILSEDETQSQAGVRAAAIEIQLADLRTAKAALIRRMQAAMIGLGKARGDELRAKAKKLQAKFDRLSADRLKLLEQIRDLEGGGANWVQEYFNRRGFLPLGPGGAMGPVGAPVFDKLEAEIRALLDEAAAIERRAEQNAAGGRISAENLEQLLAVCTDADQIAPSDLEIRSWFEQAAKAAAHAYVTSPIGAPMHNEPPALDPMTNLTLVWKAGAIDSTESNWRNLQNRRPVSWAA